MTTPAWLAEREAWQALQQSVARGLDAATSRTSAPDPSSRTQALWKTWRATYEERWRHHPPRQIGGPSRKRARIRALLAAA